MYSLVAFIFVMLLPVLAFAQHSLDTPIDSKWALGASVYQLIFPVLTVIVGWLAKKVSDWLTANTKNTAVAGVMVRLNDTVWTLVKEANQTAKDLIVKARGVDSDGGPTITRSEGEMIKQGVLDKFRDLWGADGLDKASKVLGLTEDSLMEFVGAKVEAAVNDLGKRLP